VPDLTSFLRVVLYRPLINTSAVLLQLYFIKYKVRGLLYRTQGSFSDIRESTNYFLGRPLLSLLVLLFGLSCVNMALPPNTQFADKLPMDPNYHEAIALRNAIRSHEDNITGEDLQAQFVEEIHPDIILSLPFTPHAHHSQACSRFSCCPGHTYASDRKGRIIQTLASNLSTDDPSDNDIA
jgi:hypothetical protein